jgi:dipeptidyl aminopeptidase/acylaminoacyl peptidase
LFAGQDSGVWIANPDGSFPTQISEQWLFGFDLRHALTPGGDRLAVVTRDEQGYVLQEILLPGGESRTLARLIEITAEEEAVLMSEQAIAALMISSYDNVAWNPDGRRVAVAAASNGPTSDIYLIDTVSGDVRQLTDGPSQAIVPSWSPDGDYIYHVGVSLVPPFGGAIVGFNRVDGAWGVNAGDELVVPQPPVTHPSDFAGWVDDRHYLLSDLQGYLTQVDVATGRSEEILSGFCPISSAAQSSVGGSMVLSVLPETACASGTGVYLWSYDSPDAPALLDPERAWGLSWLEESRASTTIRSDSSPPTGRNAAPPVPGASYHPAVSIAGYEAWKSSRNRARRGAGQDPWRDPEVDVAELLWDPASGETLLIAARTGRCTQRAPGLHPQSYGLPGRRCRPGDLGPLARTPQGTAIPKTRSNSSR